ncbi:MAG: Deacetylases, including yeast histone deacetylase and acetoin utilization protein [uncultured Pyrinomonadaceae bacterium]|uniref:Deacetylases, including yeast histone deacetylase and acetoin utilization protein n=1 Tax=uncultured Pyrinomonadaceae bacterium TaxID=2283094 RepID=A0A6J4NWB0_9BACT|nr:MAG: Deacetylases, including yeast histone deacetylase and acetoin utilization protein [uncultured Pyrinomonadaceae bacterium]
MNDYKIFYSPYYYADIGENHVFPIKKFELVRDKLLKEGTLQTSEIIEPQPAAIKDVLLVHTEDYITRLRNGTLTAREIRRLGLPWSKSLVRRSFLATSGTINAARYALKNAVASNLAGGTHHSFPDRGEGFCVLNDVAVAIRVLQKENLAQKFLIVDCDVHQGNGTAFIFKDDKNVFTFSMHGAKNYPLFKENSTLDIELPDKTGDAEFLEILGEALPRIFTHEPDVVFYLGGADPFEKDKLGRLGLTMEGLRRRDEMVLSFAREMEIPIVTTMSGGYAEDVNDTVEIHCNTIRAVKKIFAESQTRNALA